MHTLQKIQLLFGFYVTSLWLGVGRRVVLFKEEEEARPGYSVLGCGDLRGAGDGHIPYTPPAAWYLPKSPWNLLRFLSAEFDSTSKLRRFQMYQGTWYPQ